MNVYKIAEMLVKSIKPAFTYDPLLSGFAVIAAILASVHFFGIIVGTLLLVSIVVVVYMAYQQGKNEPL